MKSKYNLLLLAGGEKGPLSNFGDFKSKAMIPIHGKAMIDWVLEAFDKVGCIDNIVVVGPDEIESCNMNEIISKRVKSANTLVQNLLLGISYIKTNIYKFAKEHDGYILSFCDAVFLTPEIIEDTIKNIDNSQADIVLHYVEKSSFDSLDIQEKRTYIPINGKFYTGSVIYYIKKFSLIMNLLNELSQLRKHRKNPEKLLKIIGAKNDTIYEIEQGLSRTINGKVKIYISDSPMMGMDVDKPSDLEQAKKILLINKR